MDRGRVGKIFVLRVGYFYGLRLRAGQEEDSEEPDQRRAKETDFVILLLAEYISP